jgi:hypothetical protein
MAVADETFCDNEHEEIADPASGPKLRALANSRELSFHLFRIDHFSTSRAKCKRPVPG